MFDGDFLAQLYLALATLLGSALVGVGSFHATRFLEARETDAAEAVALAERLARMQAALRQVRADQQLGAAEHAAHTKGLAELRETVSRIDERTQILPLLAQAFIKRAA